MPGAFFGDRGFDRAKIAMPTGFKPGARRVVGASVSPELRIKVAETIHERFLVAQSPTVFK